MFENMIDENKMRNSTKYNFILKSEKDNSIENIITKYSRFNRTFLVWIIFMPFLLNSTE